MKGEKSILYGIVTNGKYNGKTMRIEVEEKPYSTKVFIGDKDITDTILWISMEINEHTAGKWITKMEFME